jgi:hypothetical protein
MRCGPTATKKRLVPYLSTSGRDDRRGGIICSRRAAVHLPAFTQLELQRLTTNTLLELLGGALCAFLWLPDPNGFDVDEFANAKLREFAAVTGMLYATKW